MGNLFFKNCQLASGTRKICQHTIRLPECVKAVDMLKAGHVTKIYSTEPL